ncbi:hypothetical protein [Limnoglobus roseus]|uniref:Uncharacterized protein n=1 Tax=Limnoglobus roseus TaxID=2598579 RepID=A0A5C1AMH4_9BACT|nr:hypothetical protein [Limnoglobus roseus]QEL18404.1 hypothetical protein PX52LOC_05428 [Limnoglobus roseus]
MRPILLATVFLTGNIFFSQGGAAADDKKKPAPTVAEVSVANWEQPKELKKGKDAIFWVWYENGFWYLRTTGGKDVHRFQGLITVTGGKLSNLKGLGGEKKGKLADQYVFNKDRTMLEFDFRTGGQWDGLNFAVDENATAMKFELKVDGVARPAQVKIGKDGEHPAEADFITPARPVNKTPAAATGKPKK